MLYTNFNKKRLKVKNQIKKIARYMFPDLYAKLGNLKKKMAQDKFVKNYPDTKIFFESKRELYSQDNQDYIVSNNFFKNKNKGIFCDIGGNHPLNINNTRYFEELGWNGFVFEPLSYMKPLWDKHRKAKFFNFALSDEEGEVTFTVVKDATGWEDMLSYIKDTRNADYKYGTKEITVQTRMCKNVFREENITMIDYMSIDVEGHELNVLKGIDFNKVQINVLTIENNPPCSTIYGDDRIRELMLSNKYILWGRIIGLDDIYVHEDFLKNA